MVYGSIRLDLARPLVKTWLGAAVAVCICTVVHLDSPLPGVAVCRLRNEAILPGRPDVSVLGKVRMYLTSPPPNVIRCLNFAEVRHPCESDAVVDDPKQLPIGITLHSLTCHVGTSTVPMAFEPGRRPRGICCNPGRNVYLRLQHWLSGQPAARGFRSGWPSE